MAIGIVTSDDFERELEKLNPSVPINRSVIKEQERPGRKEGDVNVPDSLRKVIGETSAIDGRATALALAQMFDVSPASVSAYANGATSTASYNSPVKSLRSHINKRKERISKKASGVLNSSLDALTETKLEKVDAKELAGIARDMSVIIKNMEPDTRNEPNEDNKAKTPQFVIFAPQFYKEEHYETINVSE